MSQYEHTITVNSPPQQVFSFVSHVDNLPRYLPTVTNAMPQGSGRVRVQGETAGRPYDSDGYYRVATARRRIEWGSDGENRYHGWLEVKGDGDDTTAAVTVHLSFDPRPDIADKYDQQSGDRHRTIQEGLEHALQSIKHQCESKGDTIESRAT
ncbi:MAG: hypothetical protein A4E19_02800 [Nitrospira sp. SG-bin1]|nr:MAG: hypothetical protein A4E19_02800 [Nitrospira sp. SG-bin1]